MSVNLNSSDPRGILLTFYWCSSGDIHGSCSILHVLCQIEYKLLAYMQGVLPCFITYSDSSSYKVWNRFEMRSLRKKETDNSKCNRAGWYGLHWQSFWNVTTWESERHRWSLSWNGLFPQMKYQLNSTLHCNWKLGRVKLQILSWKSTFV